MHYLRSVRVISLDFIPFLECGRQKDEEVKTFPSYIPASQGRRTKEVNGVQSSEGGDPRITRALESNVEHNLKTDLLCNFGIRWSIVDHRNKLDRVRDCQGGQLE